MPRASRPTLADIYSLGARGLRIRFSLLVLVGWTASMGTVDLSPQDLPPITVDDYGPWKTISGVAFSPNGEWLGWVQDRLEGEDSLYVRAVDGDLRFSVPRGSEPAFSRDSRWVAYLVSPPDPEGGRAQGASRARAPAPGQRTGQGGGGERPRTLVVRSLEAADSLSFHDVASFTFPENTDLLLIRKRGPNGDAGYEGADLVVFEPSTGVSLNLGNVSEFAVNEEGTHLAYLVDAKDQAGNGLYLLDLETRTVAPLDTDQATYAELTWNDDGTALAALRGSMPEDKAQRENVLLILESLSRPGALQVVDPSVVRGFPEGFVLSELGGLRWSDDSERIFLGIKEQADARDEREGRAGVDVWHWADVEVQSVQQVRARRNRDFTWNSVVTLGEASPSFVRLADEQLETVSQAGDSPWGIGRDPTPYEYEVAWGGSKADYYRVDLNTGERVVMEEAVGRAVGASLDGEWWLFLRNEEVIARALGSGEHVNLSRSSGVDFVNRQDDHPYELPIHGRAGFTDDGEAVLLYDRFDVWVVPLDGGQATNLTQGLGEREQIQFRVTNLESRGGGPGGFRFGGFGGGGDEEGIDLDEPILLAAYGEWTKKDGFWEVELGSEPQPLLWVDKNVGRPIKAEDADRIVFTQETFVEFPDYWVSDVRFRNPKKLTNANPQQADFAWSPGRVLIDYVDDRGNKLQATLGLPAGYQQGQRYPMLVYFYEKMSQRHHAYQGPRFDDRPHMATYASHGYLVLQPDIVYTIGKPGSSAVDDLTAAVEKVIELGYADPDRIGLQGHSWSGYQSSFMVTQTDLFAAVVTGAPPTNLVSFYNTLYRSSGTVQQGITEVGQVRMGTTPFEDFDLYVSQSPVHQAENITTPFMILHGMEDGAVDWMQGLEYYNMARRLGKEVIFLSYEGEGHHLARKENQIDFQIRMMQFFDHHLKGAQPGKWMVEGVPFLEKEYADPREMVDGTRWGKPKEEGEGGRGKERGR